MSEATYSRGGFLGRSGGMDSGSFNQRNPGRYEAQAARIHVKSSEDDDSLFDKQPNRVDTVKFVAAQRKLIDYVSTGRWRKSDLG